MLVMSKCRFLVTWKCYYLKVFGNEYQKEIGCCIQCSYTFTDDQKINTPQEVPAKFTNILLSGFLTVYCRILNSSHNRRFRRSYIRIIGLLYRIEAWSTIFGSFFLSENVNCFKKGIVIAPFPNPI